MPWKSICWSCVGVCESSIYVPCIFHNELMLSFIVYEYSYWARWTFCLSVLFLAFVAFWKAVLFYSKVTYRIFHHSQLYLSGLISPLKTAHRHWSIMYAYGKNITRRKLLRYRKFISVSSSSLTCWSNRPIFRRWSGVTTERAMVSPIASWKPLKYQ